MTISILVPVLSRPQNAHPLVASIRVNSIEETQILFLCTPGDDEEIKTCQRTGADVHVVDWEAGPGDWAKKINRGFELTTSDFCLLGADDLLFHSAWDHEALQVAETSGAGVIGTNDLGNATVMAGNHSTHPLVRRAYVEQHGTIDEPGKCLHEGYQHQWCNPPEAPIWMADLGFRALGDIKAGDEVVGWRREPAGRFTLNRLCVSTVLATTTRTASLVRVTLESGQSLRCTADHRWLNGRWSPSSPRDMEWITPLVGRFLSRVIAVPSPVTADQQHAAGWLGGIYDGEGSGMYAALQSEKANPEVVAEIERVLRLLEIPFTRGVRPSQGRFGADVTEFVLTGGRQGYVTFLDRVRPVKREILTKRVLGSRFGERDRIVDVSPDGEAEVVSLSTETGNYVAWGYASRNCDTELVETAKVRWQWAFAKASVVEHLHPFWKKSKMDATYQKALSSSHEDHAHFQERKALWSRAAMRGRR